MCVCLCMSRCACDCDCAFVFSKSLRGRRILFAKIRFVVFIHLQHFTTFILFHAFYLLSYGKHLKSYCRSDSELYESFGKWNPMVAFLMWLPNGNFHIVFYMFILYCRILTIQIHQRYAFVYIDNIFFIYINIYFIHSCVYRFMFVWAPTQYIREWQWRLNKRAYIQHTLSYVYLYMCQTLILSETCWALKT